MQQGLDNKISNIIGAQIPTWVLRQLETRSRKNASDSRDNDNILFIANKTAWIRLVSSINVQSEEDLNYFKRLVGDEYITDPTSLAKNFVLFGGTSKYLDKNSYQLRSGLGKGGAYGMLGNREIQDFGYKPMPGITSVTIDTQGRLGSVRAATINFKCWDKDQLDIIDALYFKLGFTMFLEWGHTFYYPNADNSRNNAADKIISTELYSIDPFQPGLAKEDINIKISQNSRDTEGNYDAMLGMVTNFNFSYNQDGGYDCTLKLLGLGYLGDSIKINNAGTLPSLLEEEILKLNKTLADIEYARLAKEAAAAAAANAAANPAVNTPTTQPTVLKVEELINLHLKYDAGSNIYTGAKIIYNSLVRQDIKFADLVINNTAYGEIFVIRKLKGYIPLRSDLLDQVKIKFDGPAFFNLLKEVKIDLLGKDLFKSSDNVTEQIFSIFTADAWSKIITELFQGGPDFDAATQFPTRDASILYVSQNKLKYTIDISRRKFAETTNPDVLSPYYPINDKEFVDQLTNALNSEINEFVIEDISFVDIIAQPGSASNDKVNIAINFTIPFTRTVKVKKTGQIDPVTLQALPDTEVDESVKFNLLVKLKIQDTRFIKSFTVPSTVIQPIEFTGAATQPEQTQNTGTGQTAPVAPAAPAKPDINAIATQIKQSLNYQSSLEITLRTIQVHGLNKAINKTGAPDLDIGKTTYVLNLWDAKDIVNFKDANSTKSKSPFLNQIFSSGVFSTFINDLVFNENKRINELEYNLLSSMDPELRFKIHSKYGFATNLMGNKALITELEPVNFKELLKAYVIPYQINQEIIKGTIANHPVYIPLGQLLMILNHACIIYDTKKDSQFQTPLIYIDFNPELNFCLTNSKHLSTDPWTCLIPFEGGFEDFKMLFDKDILDGNSIKGTDTSKKSIPLYNPETQDLLSGQLPKLKFDEQPIEGGSTKEIGNVYRGKLMNILLNIDYLVQLIQQYGHKDGSNTVYLKTFIEQVLTDINKSLGNFNAFRLSYNDSANTYQIIDDQVIPTLGNEEQLMPKDNTTELPLLGKNSIAKSIEIKSEISGKLSNMLAISANSTIPNKATLSTNGDSFGFINTNFIDRYITDRLEITGSNQDKKSNDALKVSAEQFNSTISDFYSKINPSQTTVGHATNYYIEKMTTIKNDEYATRASFMIPVSVNLTIDGISGFNMGQAFSIPDKLLPYTYTARKTEGFSDIRVRNVGFVTVGLTHKIENNQWDTSIRANMIFLKNKTEFEQTAVKKIEAKTGQFGVNQSNASSVTGFGGTPLTSGTIVKGKIEARPYTFAEITTQVIAHLEGGYFDQSMLNDGRLADTPSNRQTFQSSGETMFGIDRNYTKNTPLANAFWAIIDRVNARATWKHEYIPPDPLKTEILNATIAVQQKAFNDLFNAYIKSKDLQNLITNDGRLYFNFVYAVWNGSGYFEGFSKKISEAYASGTTSPDELLKLFINLRLNIRQMPDFAGYAQWAVNLIARGGRTIAGITGVQLT
jgi:hypothetical protein